MEKYGVETPMPPNRCPICGQPARRVGRVRLCLQHGSAPFEGTSEAATEATSTAGVESAGTGDDQSK